MKKMEFKNIKQLKKEIEYWDDIEKQIDNCPKEDYKEFTKLEKLWMNCPIEILKAKLQTLQNVCEEIKKFFEGKENVDVIDIKELLKKFQGDEKCG